MITLFKNKTDRHDINEILLKVALNTITLTPKLGKFWFFYHLNGLSLFLKSTFYECHKLVSINFNVTVTSVRRQSRHVLVRKCWCLIILIIIVDNSADFIVWMRFVDKWFVCKYSMYVIKWKWNKCAQYCQSNKMLRCEIHSNVFKKRWILQFYFCPFLLIMNN